jgi:hypothetical protein
VALVLVLASLVIGPAPMDLVLNGVQLCPTPDPAVV